jgi:hypothetical protein
LISSCGKRSFFGVTKRSITETIITRTPTKEKVNLSPTIPANISTFGDYLQNGQYFGNMSAL